MLSRLKLCSLFLVLGLSSSITFAQPPFGGGRGGRGSFDPSSFLDRLDRNGNGMIDTDEMQGPAKYMIDRMARENPKIDTSKPISLDKIKSSFEKMREQRDNQGRDQGQGDRKPSEQQLDEAMQSDQLVMGFGIEEPPLPILGFGTAGELFDVVVLPEDMKKSEERMAQYDRNRDGYLGKDELKGNWFGNPLDFDRNGDQRLSAAELSVRYARRRVAEREVRESNDKRSEDSRDRRRKSDREEDDPFDGRRSFRSLADEARDGLPGWFTERDKDGDGQVMMAEYSSEWTDALAREFFGFDRNRDGVITPAECLDAVESGVTASASSSRSSASSSSSRMSSRSSADPAPTGAVSANSASGNVDSKYVEYAKRIVSRSDKNQDGVLTAAEWKTMLLDVSAADADRDGRITVEEYALWMQSRSKR